MYGSPSITVDLGTGWVLVPIRDARLAAMPDVPDYSRAAARRTATSRLPEIALGLVDPESRRRDPEPRRQPRLLTLPMRHGVERYRYRLHDTTSDDLGTVEHPVHV
jgi:hypothetical protein